MELRASCQSGTRHLAQPAPSEGEVKGVYFIGFQSVDVEEAISTLRKELKKLIMEDDWSNSPHKKWIPRLSPQQVNYFFQEANFAIVLLANSIDL